MKRSLGDEKKEESAAKRTKVEPAAAAPASSSNSSSSSSSSSSSAPAGAGAGAAPAVNMDSFKKSAAYLEAVAGGSKGLKRLVTEWTRTSQSKDFEATLVDNDLYLWEVKIPFDNTSLLGQDLLKYTNSKFVTVRIAFDPTHPFKPPFVRVRTPRFLKGTSNVMEGGAICVDTFSVAGWSPAMTAEKSIVAIQSVLLTPGLDARLDPKDWAKEYTEEEAKVSLKVIQQAHRDWQQPQFSTPPPAPAYQAPAYAPKPAAAKPKRGRGGRKRS